jgi:NAD(P)-dependent dehydrogenase (short-subunit alcohol dehydrogenase family)
LNRRPFTVLVIGGYGTFGGRICRLLAAEPGLRILVAGRSSAKASALVREVQGAHPAADLEAWPLDIEAGLGEALRASAAGLVIHTAGPFQGQDYRVARACIEQGVHYVDLADGRAFVSGIEQLDGPARDADVLAVAGASTVPAVSAAVVDHLARDLSALESIAIGITPGNRVERGLSLMAAILGTVGRPVPRRRGGRWTTVYGWQGLFRRTLSVPGLDPLGPRWFAAGDVPDLVLFPGRYPGAPDVAFHAGLELTVLHLGLWLLSWPVRWRILPGLAALAPPARHVAALVERLGSDRGGMFVELTGTDARGGPVNRCWTLIAQSGHGPSIPCVPAVILARGLAQGRLTERGARPCLDLFGLDDFTEAVRRLDIHWAVAERPA